MLPAAVRQEETAREREQVTEGEGKREKAGLASPPPKHAGRPPALPRTRAMAREGHGDGEKQKGRKTDVSSTVALSIFSNSSNYFLIYMVTPKYPKIKVAQNLKLYNFAFVTKLRF
jgi:hypothetical protein